MALHARLELVLTRPHESLGGVGMLVETNIVRTSECARSQRSTFVLKRRQRRRRRGRCETGRAENTGSAVEYGQLTCVIESRAIPSTWQ